MEQMIDEAGSHFAHCTLEVFAQATVTMAMSGHKCFLIRNEQNYMSMRLSAFTGKKKKNLTEVKLCKLKKFILLKRLVWPCSASLYCSLPDIRYN